LGVGETNNSSIFLINLDPKNELTTLEKDPFITAIITSPGTIKAI
jgi:hypothetical protein